MMETILHQLAALATALTFQAVEFPKVDRNIDLAYKDWSSLPELMSFFKELGWWGTIALILAVIAHFVYKFMQRKDWAKMAELRADQSREVLKIAEKERSKMEVAFSSGRSVPCAMLEATDQIVRLEVPDYANITNDFAGKEVQCFFRIRDPKGKTKFLFFNFTTRILGVVPREDHFKTLSLASPTEMFQGQKRSSYRLAPPRGMILDFKAWPDSFSQAPVTQLPEATLSFKPSSGVMRTFVSNISSGGLLLEVERNQLARSSLPLDTGKSWFMRLVVRDPVKETNLAWWLVGRLVKVFENTNARYELAFKFTAFGAGIKENRRVDWRIPRGEDGVPEISAWVFKRAVELVREGRSTD